MASDRDLEGPEGDKEGMEGMEGERADRMGALVQGKGWSGAGAIEANCLNASLYTPRDPHMGCLDKQLMGRCCHNES